MDRGTAGVVVVWKVKEVKMYSAAFIFEPGGYDEEFHRLNDLIDEAARATPGFLGAESWHSPDGKKVNATYYWDNMDALKAFSRHRSA